MPTLNLSAVDYSRVVNKSHTAVELESAELLVVLLPAMGRVYRVINKHTAHDVLWRNDIARPGGANNKLGWWLWLGGVEYTLPGEEHGYTWALPWVWSVVEDSAARKAVQAMVREPSTGLVETLTFSLALNDTTHFSVDVKIPPELDWFSVDIYHMDGYASGWVDAHVKSYYEKWIFPNISSAQKALLVPGSFGSDVNHYPNGTYVCDKSCYDDMCARDAGDFYAWASTDDRVAGVLTWNYGGCAACNGSHWTPPHTCCMDEIGTKDMPKALAAWEAVGRKLIGA